MGPLERSFLGGEVHSRSFSSRPFHPSYDALNKNIVIYSQFQRMKCNIVLLLEKFTRGPFGGERAALASRRK